MKRFSLWDQPWIPVVLPSGQADTLSLRDVLARAHRLREVYDPSPLVTVAIHRLLQAVLYRVFRPERKGDWAGLWRRGQFDEERIDGYGALWAERFDLFHPTRPFYQVPLIPDEKVHPISALIMEAASGNNPTLFDHGLAEGAAALAPDRAACHLVMHQLFALGGGVSKPFNRMDGPLTKGLVVEAKSRENLFETLLLNLIPLEYWRVLLPGTEAGEDRPVWELESFQEPAREGTRPLGPMHYLTWQSRQLHLVADPQTGLVSGCQIRQRYCLPKDGERVDPGKAYRRSKDEGWLPFKIDKQRAVWQFTHVLLQQTKEDVEPPLLMRWLPEARRTGVAVPAVVLITVSGLTTDPKKAAKIDLWRREQLPLPLDFLERPELVGDLEDLLKRARRVEVLLARTAAALVWAIADRQKLAQAVEYIWTGKVSEGGKIPSGYAGLAPSLGLVLRFWPALEAPFREAMTELPEAEELQPVLDRWQAAVQRAAREAFQTARDGLLYTEAPFEVLSRIEHAFQTRLAGIFAEDEEKGGLSSDDEESDE